MILLVDACGEPGLDRSSQGQAFLIPQKYSNKQSGKVRGDSVKPSRVASWKDSSTFNFR